MDEEGIQQKFWGRGDGNFLYLDCGGSYKDGLACKNSMSCTIETSTFFKKNKHILMQRSFTEKQN